MTRDSFTFTEAGGTPSGQQIVNLVITDPKNIHPEQPAGSLCMWPDQWRTLRARLRHAGIAVQP